MVKKPTVAALKASTQASRANERSSQLAPGVTSRLEKLRMLDNDAPTPAHEIVERLVEKPVPDRLPLESIKDRVTNLRPVYEDRARSLAGNIALVGLIQPIAIDLHGRLLAGDHRRRALAILRELSEWPDRLKQLLPDLAEGDADTQGKALTAWRRLGFDMGVPVHRIHVDAAGDPALAKAIELSENTQREAFTKEEVKEAYKALVAAGFRHTVGRPKKGERAIGPQLELLYGRASRTIVKYVAEIRGEVTSSPPQAPDVSAEATALQIFAASASLRVGKNGAGAITIPFASLDELKALVRRLK